MKKRIVCLLLALVTLFTLCGCDSGGKYKVVKSVGDREYSIGFRNGDTTYHYINAAIRELSYDGTVDNLCYKWFGSQNAVNFPRDKDAMQKLGYIEPRIFTIGVDLLSAPLCIQSGSDYDGFDVELARAVCSKLGWQLRVQPILSDNAYVELNSGNIDCAWGGVVMDVNSSDYTILFTYMTDELVLAAKGNGKSSLGGGSLYIGTENMYMELLENNPNIEGHLGQITRVAGTPAEHYGFLDHEDCDFIVTTKNAVEYYNYH